ncbi:unnamed protein product [Owenia fusiformis]|uniref:Kringle domain-containing protein n=1 Tax=Owenia fusiformis TaxID=6347 RepID=A0A8S4PYR4_OWEFU|nr:unnamed protein product [Owenia fusiformis]
MLHVVLNLSNNIFIQFLLIYLARSRRGYHPDTTFPFNLTMFCKLSVTGEEYTGHMSETRGGHKCMQWSKQRPHEHTLGSTDREFIDGSVKAAKNYCRNVNSDPLGPWCYTTNKRVEFDYCDVPVCSEQECKRRFEMTYFDVTAQELSHSLSFFIICITYVHCTLWHSVHCSLECICLHCSNKCSLLQICCHCRNKCSLLQICVHCSNRLLF